MALSFVNTDADAVLQEAVSQAESSLGKTLYPASPERLFLAALAYLHTLRLAQINQAANQNLVSFATGTHLDRLADLMGITRKGASSATVLVRFSASGPAGSDIPVPQGTRVSPDGQLLFATDVAAQIDTGLTSIDIACTATLSGASHNGFLPKQITTLVDPVAGIATVENLTESSGGADTEADEDLRGRIKAAPSTFSVGGPSEAYRTLALAADASVVDAAVRSNAPGEVEVTILATGGQAPGTTLLQTVQGALSDRTKRPLTDGVLVRAPVFVSFDVVFTYYVERAYEASLSSIQSNVSSTVADYVSWQTAALGRDINPDELRGRVLAVVGVKRLVVTSPIFTAVDATQGAVVGTQTLTYGGVEDL